MAEDTKVRKIERKRLSLWPKVGITTGVTAALVVLYLWGQGFFRAEAAIDKIKIFSDGTFTIGILTLAMGGILFVSQHGAFDAIAYSMKQFWWYMQVKNAGKKHETYREYRERQAAKPKVKFLHLVIVGVFWLVISGVFVILFFRLFEG